MKNNKKLIILTILVITILIGLVSGGTIVYFRTTSRLSLADYVKAQYTGIQGENNLYYHNGTIKDDDGNVIDAGDDSYRYAGSSNRTNNFVCFGSDASACPDDNLYRIIGVFGDQVKLIKWDYATSELLGTGGDYSGTYQISVLSENKGISKGTNIEKQIGAYWWNYDGKNKWSRSKLNKINLNKIFIKNIGKKWTNKIAVTKWKVSAVDVFSGDSASVVFKYENSGKRTYNAKIALMYISDYGFAADSTAWATGISNYEDFTNENWMYMGLWEWTITRLRFDTFFPFNSTDVYVIPEFGGILGKRAGARDSAWAVRPVFYLNSNVKYVSGDGTKTTPIIIN